MRILLKIYQFYLWSQDWASLQSHGLFISRNMGLPFSRPTHINACNFLTHRQDAWYKYLLRHEQDTKNSVKKTCCAQCKKKPAYGRHWISRPMRIEEKQYRFFCSQKKFLEGSKVNSCGGPNFFLVVKKN